jgi:TolA-binding protein
MALPFEQKEELFDTSMMTNEMTRRMNEDSRRIRTVEQRLDRIEQQIETLESTALNTMEDIKIGIEKMVAKITLISDKLNGIESEIARLNKEMTKTATKSELKEMETFIDLVNPITSKFVTKDEMMREFEERLKRKA